jgi:predicted esterase
VPSNYLEAGSIKSVGVVIAHGVNAELQRGPLLGSLATHLAKQGYVVMRYFCKQKEQRRQRILERSVDTVVASPYGRGVKKWVFIGHENGARIATLVGYKTHRPKHGFIYLSYPLIEPAPPPPKQKAGAEPPVDSIGPLLKLVESVKAPQLFICGELDYNCPGADLKALGPQLKAASIDARAVIFENLDAHFKTPEATEATPETSEKIFELIDTFLQGVESDSVASLDLPSFDSIVPSARVPPRPETAASPEDGAEEDDDMEIGGGSGAGGSLQNPVNTTTNAPAMNPATMLAAAQHAALLQQQQRLAAGMSPAAAQQAQQIQALQMAMFQQQLQAAALQQQQQQQQQQKR